MPRASAYRKSYGIEKKERKEEFLLVSTEVRDGKVAEKEKMQKLNNRLVNYVDKVHDLETANRILLAENARLRKMKKTPETDVDGIYDDELKRLREKVEDLQKENAEIAIDRDNAEYNYEETSKKLTEEQEENKELEKELEGLRKDVDDATIERVTLESKIENLQEAIHFEKKVHEAELENLRNQIQPLEAPLLQSENNSILPDLTDTIANVRKQYESFNAKSLEDLDNFYKEKVENLQVQLKNTNEEVNRLRVDNNDKRKVIQRLELEIEKLRGNNDNLERNVENLEDKLAKEVEENQKLISNMNKELDTTKQDLGKYLRDYQKLRTVTLSLEQEIAIYHKVLTGEEDRINELDLDKSVRRSRSSSRSSRSSRSSHSSKSSRSRSGSRSRSRSPVKTDDVVDQMVATEINSKPTTLAGEFDQVDVPQKVDDYEQIIADNEKSSEESDSKWDDQIVERVQEKEKEGEKGDVREESSSSSSSSSEEENENRENSKKKKAKVPKVKEGVVKVSWKIKGGTVRPAHPFNPLDDAEELHKAMSGFGTDEKTIINILTHRTKEQRLQIATAYNSKYDKDLLKHLDSELDGDLKITVQHLMWEKSELDARAIHKAIKGAGTEEDVVMEILYTQTWRQVAEIRRVYSLLFKKDLYEEIESDTSGDFRILLLEILKANRPVDTGTVVSNDAEEDAKALYEMGVKNWTPSNSVFLEIFTQRSFQHLWFLFQQSWPQLSSDDLIETVNKEFSGDMRMAIKTMIRFSSCVPPIYYAYQINETMTGPGTSESYLIYIVTTRSEIDLIDVKEEYESKYSKSLVQTVDDETSGDFGKIMLALLD